MNTTAANDKQIVMRLMKNENGSSFWFYEIIQRGEVIKCFLTAEEAVAYI